MPSFWAKEGTFYAWTSLFGLGIFAVCYGYIKWLGIPGELNKSVADAAIILMGFSMWLSSLCYFWDALDWAIIYRKYLGLIGFAFAIAHLVLSWQPFMALFTASTWEQDRAWPAFAGTVALVIFAIMALISNSFAAKRLGGKVWRYILRTGYIAVLFVLAHVVLLRWARWVTWFQEGMPTPPSPSLIVSVFMVVVVVMRAMLWWSIGQKRLGVRR